MELFANLELANRRAAMPLAARMRPRNLDEFVGQQHLLAPGQLLRRLIEADRLGSVILFGPPGTGKTTLAQLLAGETGRHFEQLSAVLHGVKELRDLLSAARDRLAAEGRGTLLFIDEIHRFNRAQQDALLADVESGVVTLVGATTSNPFFAVNGALLSRSQLLEFHPLTADEVRTIIERALSDRERGLGEYRVQSEPAALAYLAEISEGDARQALAILETAVLSSQPPVVLNKQAIDQSISRRAQQYDVTGDEHFDCASALIKSIRGSDVDAAIYWLARMLEGGEEIRFLCRRLVILASEDVGNADPHALPLAVACMQACEFIGLPECQLTLSQTVAYLACAPKSNAATAAIGRARDDVRTQRVIPVPKHLQDSHYSGARKLERGTGYQYAHDFDGGIVSQAYLGVDREYYLPVDRGFEAELQQRLEKIRSILRSKRDTTKPNH